LPDNSYDIKNEPHVGVKDDMPTVRYAWLKLYDIPQLAIATNLSQRIEMRLWYNSRGPQRENPRINRYAVAILHFFDLLNKRFQSTRDNTPLSLVYRREESPMERSDIAYSVIDEPKETGLHIQTNASHSTINIEIVPPDEDYEDSISADPSVN
jgi:hypothetical protein